MDVNKTFGLINQSQTNKPQKMHGHDCEQTNATPQEKKTSDTGRTHEVLHMGEVVGYLKKQTQTHKKITPKTRNTHTQNKQKTTNKQTKHTHTHTHTHTPHSLVPRGLFLFVSCLPPPCSSAHHSICLTRFDCDDFFSWTRAEQLCRHCPPPSSNLRQMRALGWKQ